MPKITPFLWFDTQAEEAANFYISVFKDGKILNLSRYGEAGPGPAGSVMVVEFELMGQALRALNAGPMFKFNEAISLQIDCEDQAEIDYYWDALTAGGGEPGRCGWLKDRFGLSWQVTPRDIERFFGGEPAKAQRAMTAMMGMGKLDIAALENA